jgi:hypothetical protein
MWRGPTIKIQSRRSVLTVFTHRSAKALARGALIGVRNIDAISSKDLIEATAVLSIAVVDEELHRGASILEEHQ